MKKFILVLSATMLFSIGFNGVGFAYNVWHVDSGILGSDTDIDPNRGKLWLKPFKTIKKAILVASNNDEIWVMAGVYEISGGPIQVNKSVRIFAGFGELWHDLDDRDWETYETTIEPLYKHNPPSHLLKFSADAVLDGFHINHGGDITFDDGGGIRVQGCSPTIKNCAFKENEGISGGAIANFNSSTSIIQCTFKNNRADNYGGAIYNSNSDVFISNCLFENNSAFLYGGGAISNEGNSSRIHCVNSTFTGNEAVNGSGGAIFEGIEINELRNISGGTYINSEFHENSAKEDGGAIRSVGTIYINIEKCTFKFNESNRGGAIFAYDNSIPSPLSLGLGPHDYITDSAFTSNKAHSEGGAIVESGRIKITGCIFFNNRAGSTDIDGSGGAISFERPSYLDPGSYAVRDCIFNLNFADYGGAFINKGARTEIFNCKFSRNEATIRGGAIHCEGKDGSGSGPNIKNCTFTYNNSTEDGGAIFIDSVRIINIHNTFYNNSCNWYGGAIRFINSPDPSFLRLIIANSILWGNRSIGGYPDKEISIEGEVGKYIVANNIDEADYVGIDHNIRQDPLIVYDAYGGSVHLRRGSPCINRGLNTLDYGFILPEKDFEGDPRIISTAPDMGADELLLKVPIDIIPKICPNTYNVADPANLTVAILGTNGFDINSIDHGSIEISFENIVINEVTNIRVKNVGRPSYPYGECGCRFGQDRFNDLIFEVDPDEISHSLPPDISEGDELVLTISGLLEDGTHFTGKDCIIISIGNP